MSFNDRTHPPILIHLRLSLIVGLDSTDFTNLVYIQCRLYLNILLNESALYTHLPVHKLTMHIEYLSEYSPVREGEWCCKTCE